MELSTPLWRFFFIIKNHYIFLASQVHIRGNQMDLQLTMYIYERIVSLVWAVIVLCRLNVISFWSFLLIQLLFSSVLTSDTFVISLQPAAGIPVPGLNGASVTCKYPADRTVVLGYLSVAFLVASTVVGYLSLFYPYKGKSIPQGVLFKHTTFTVFFNISL